MYIYNMEKHIQHANNLLADINKETCFECTKNNGNIRLAILICKANLDTLKRHNNIHGLTNQYDTLEQVIQWTAVKEYLKGLL